MSVGTTVITRTAKIQILPDERQERLLKETLKVYAAACNYVASYIYEKRELRRLYLHGELYPVLRDPEKFGLRSQMAESVLKTVTARTKSMIKVLRDWGKPNFRHPVCDLVWNRDYSLREEYFSVNTLKGREKMRYRKQGMERYFDGSWRFGTAKLVHKHGKWYLHIPMSREEEKKEGEENGQIVGCDLGINFLVTTYDSEGKTRFLSGKEVKQKRAVYQKTITSLKEKKTPSARKRLGKVLLRENCWMQDVNHCASKALVERYPKGTLFVIEKPNRGPKRSEQVVAGENPAAEEKKPKEVTVSWSFSDIRYKLEYKAGQKGSKVLEVEPAYSSQRCPKCGEVKKANRKKRSHEYRCERCGYESNDDRIAAMNLYEKGREYRSTDAKEQAALQGAESAVPGCNVKESLSERDPVA